jgi:hypothetical protein
MQRSQPLRRTPMKRKPARRGAMDAELRYAVMRRDNFRCQARERGYAPEVECYGRLHAHHIVLGSKVDTMDNLIAVCLAHHRHLHDVDRAGAEAFGLIVRHDG